MHFSGSVGLQQDDHPSIDHPSPCPLSGAACRLSLGAAVEGGCVETAGSQSCGHVVERDKAGGTTSALMMCGMGLPPFNERMELDEQQDGQGPTSAHQVADEDGRKGDEPCSWFVASGKEAVSTSRAHHIDSTTAPLLRTSAPPALHPFDPTFSPPSPLSPTAPFSISDRSVSCPSVHPPPSLPPTPSPPNQPRLLPAGCILIPSVDDDEEDAEYWSQLPIFQDGPGSPGWPEWQWESVSGASATTPTPPPPSPRRSFSLPLPITSPTTIRSRPTRPTRVRSAPVVLSSSSSSSSSAASRGRARTPIELGSSTSGALPLTSPTSPTSVHRARSRSRSPPPRRRQPPSLPPADTWSPISPPSSDMSLPDLSEEEGDGTTSADSASDSDDDEEEEGDNSSLAIEFDERFVDLAELRRMHTLSLSSSCTSSASPSPSRVRAPSPSKADEFESITQQRRRSKTLYFGGQYWLFALGRANARRTGEGYWSDRERWDLE